MKIYTGETIEGINQDRHDVVCADVEFKKCKFDNCFVSPFSVRHDLLQMGRLANAVFNGSVISETCSQLFGKLENVLFDNVKISGYLRLEGFLFSKFKIKGRCGSIYLGSKMEESWSVWQENRNSTDEEMDSFNQHCNDYYKTVEWAIDIREAEFAACAIQGLPLELIRRDPKTQVIVRKEKLEGIRINELKFSKNSIMQYKLAKADADFLAIACKRSKYYEDALHDINLLKEAGLAD